jgi:hypothetical protein
VSGEQGELDGETGRGQGLGQGPHGLGIAGETVQDENPVRTARGGPRLGAGDDGSYHGTGCYRSDPGGTGTLTASGPWWVPVSVGGRTGQPTGKEWDIDGHVSVPER